MWTILANAFHSESIALAQEVEKRNNLLLGWQESDEEREAEGTNWFGSRQRYGDQFAPISIRRGTSKGFYNYVKDYSIFLPFVLPERGSKLNVNLIGVCVCMLLQRGFHFWTPRQLSLVISSLASTSPWDAYSALVIYVLLKVVALVVGELRSTRCRPLFTDSQQRLEIVSYSHIMNLSADFHDSKSTASLFNGIGSGRGILEIIRTIGFSLGPDIVDLLLASVYFYKLFGPYLALIGIATGISNMLIKAWALHLEAAHMRPFQNLEQTKTQLQWDTVHQWVTVSYSNRVVHSIQLYRDLLMDQNKLESKTEVLSKLTDVLQTSSQDLGWLGAACIVIYQIMFSGAPVGSFVALMNYWPSIVRPFERINHLLSRLNSGFLNAEALLRVWKIKPSVLDGPEELLLDRNHPGLVRFESVHFRYKGKKHTIEDLTFEAIPGQTIALVGETGAGKSTILKLLFRFYDVSKGCITVDGQDVRNVTLESLRTHMSVVPQEPALFNLSILENVRYARLEATDEEVHNACRAAAIHDKNMAFPKGYDTRVGASGVKLSGGERQRIAVARAILKSSSIVLLDEATSAVDTETEEKIHQGLQRLCRGRTTFVIAHRLSTIQHADRILVIKDGGIYEQGSPKELLARKGQYYKLWTKQMGLFDAKAEEEEKIAAHAVRRSSRIAVQEFSLW